MKFVMPKPRLVFMVECESCSDAQRGGVKDLIFHYADKHCIPTEWPSERASRLTGTEATKPYTTIAATRKRRRKQTTPRPLNSFMVNIIDLVVSMTFHLNLIYFIFIYRYLPSTFGVMYLLYLRRRPVQM